jgi:hypothetical protein
MLKYWHIIISGYSQSYRTPTGCERIWLALHAATDTVERCLYFPWNAPWCDIAEFIKRCSEPDAEVYIYAYSWGAGYGFVSLAEELQKRGLPVTHAVLCDPVWRRKGIPAGLNWIGSLSSVWADSKLDVPANVQEVSWCYQRNNKPDGDTPTAAKGATTIIHPGVKIENAIHPTIDESEWFMNTSLKVAEVIDERNREYKPEDQGHHSE